VENPREVVQPGDDVKVRILEIDSDRRRLSLSVKRVEGQILPIRTPEIEAVPEGAGDLDDVPELGLSDDVFAAGQAPAEPEVAEAPAEPAAGEPEAAAPQADTPAAADEPEAAAAEAAETRAEPGSGDAGEAPAEQT
jgi:small subunit ribosomal protein S1